MHCSNTQAAACHRSLSNCRLDQLITWLTLYRLKYVFVFTILPSTEV